MSIAVTVRVCGIVCFVTPLLLYYILLSVYSPFSYRVGLRFPRGLKIVCFSLRVLKYVVCLCKRCYVFYLYCEAWSCKCLCMGSVSVSSCKCCILHDLQFINPGQASKR